VERAGEMSAAATSGAPRLSTWQLRASPSCSTTAATARSLTPSAAALLLRSDPVLSIGTAVCILNHMVQYTTTLDRTFSALSDPTRRAILERLGRGPATIGELAEPFGMSLTGLKKHVRVLEEAHLVSTEKVGRARECRLDLGNLDDAGRWIEGQRGRWERRLDKLEGFIERKRRGGRA
jgi:DNA-binding transcriptional ArsR family regulator